MKLILGFITFLLICIFCIGILIFRSEIKELKERCKAWETAFKNLDHLYHEVNEEKCKFEIENKSLITRNHIVPEHYLSEAIDRCNELEAQIKKMKPYCKELCKNYQRTGFMGNDCQNGVCKKCDKWEIEK